MYKRQAQQQLSASCEALDTLHSGFLQTAASLQHNPLVAQALFDAEAEDTAVYSQLFDATESVHSFARFDLYDISGRWRYSTQAVFWCAARQKIRPTQTSRFCTLRCS